MIEEELFRLLKARKGHFRYEAGHHGDLWLDLDSLYFHPRQLQPFIAELAARLRPKHAQMICGPMTGGAFIAQMLAVELECAFCWTERITAPEGVRYQVPGAVRPLVSGQRVVVVDDVINAGSAIGGTLRDLQQCGADIIAIGALLILGQKLDALIAGSNIAIESLARGGISLWEPSDCPLCATDVALEDLVSPRT